MNAPSRAVLGAVAGTSRAFVYGAAGAAGVITTLAVLSGAATWLFRRAIVRELADAGRAYREFTHGVTGKGESADDHAP